MWSDRSTRPWREEAVANKQANEALEKLNQGIQKTKRMVQLQTMKLAQEYFGDSIETLKQQVKESHATLEDLPRRIPWGQEESFQILFQDLMENYVAIERSLDEAGKNVANLDAEQLRGQGELKATAAAIREAKRRGVDLRDVEGTGSEGRILVNDVRRAAKGVNREAVEKEDDREEPKALDAAERKAEELGIDLKEIEGVGVAGLITGNGATNLAKETREKEAGAKGEGAALTWQTSGNGVNQRPATNAAKRKAEELGIDLKEVKGTGSGGLITMSDVLKKT